MSKTCSSCRYYRKLPHTSSCQSDNVVDLFSQCTSNDSIIEWHGGVPLEDAIGYCKDKTHHEHRYSFSRALPGLFVVFALSLGVYLGIK